MLPPLARIGNAADTIPAHHLHSSLNKVKHPVNVVRWTPEGRRLLTASSSGEFTLWNGTGFNFETIQQAHDVAIRALSYSQNGDWLISADHEGIIKYWQPNFNNVKIIQGHTDPIRDMAFSPTDSKFVTASDDSTLKIFDFAEGVEESTITGHGWDAKSVDWHPTKGLIVSGSKDHLVKLWDPRTSRCLTTLHGHKNTITKTIFERVRGMCLATSARDQTARVFDLRMMRDICLLKGHEKDVSTMTWHPIHSNMLSTGGSDGSMFHYLLDEPHTPAGQAPSIPVCDAADPATAPSETIYPAHRMQYAHDFAIWSLDWHPLGHILASGSNDRLTRFWTRARPGDQTVLKDRYHIGEEAAEAQGTWDRRHWRQKKIEDEEQETEDEARGLEDQAAEDRNQQSGFPGIPGMGQVPPSIPGLPGLSNAPAPMPNFPGLSGGLPPPFPSGAGFPPPPNPLALGLDPNNPPSFEQLQEMMKAAGIPPPPPPGSGIARPPPGFQFPPNPSGNNFPPPFPGTASNPNVIPLERSSSPSKKNGKKKKNKRRSVDFSLQFGSGFPGEFSADFYDDVPEPDCNELLSANKPAHLVGSSAESFPPPPVDFFPNGTNFVPEHQRANRMVESPKDGSIRKRGPLPSQEESLRMEMMQGKFKPPR